eukprot:TRINITY_DN9479_c4_g1_i1.p1 TRINITY_DN9479_c4_g1~~TRINITY_DN9479_c4_g1_i1.p1  ORF type:complete len:308 (+),score=63.10 TRINITY_DN9479_c4_g1_i1:43-924(+)
MSVDAWIQHPTEEITKADWNASIGRWTSKGGPSKEVQDKLKKMALKVSTTLSVLDAGGIEYALTSAWYSKEGVLISNEQVHEFVKQSKGRLFGIGSVDTNKPNLMLNETKKCILEYGFKAMRILPWLWNMPPTHRNFYPLFAICEELGVPLCIQVGHTGPLRTSEFGRPIPYIDRIALDFPDLKIVCGHIGYPWTDEMIAVATKYPNVFIDTSAYVVNRYPQAIIDYMRSKSGRYKVLFGSNYPMLPPQRCLVNQEKLYAGLPDKDAVEVRHLFMRGNSERVFKLDLPVGAKL